MGLSLLELPNISDSGSGSGSASDEGSSDDQYAYDHYEESGSGQESGSALWDEDMSDQGEWGLGLKLGAVQLLTVVRMQYQLLCASIIVFILGGFS